MKIPDANVLLYARDVSSTRHEAAREWIERNLSATETIGFATAVILAFVRIATNPRAMARPLTARAAIDQVEEWLTQPPAAVVHPGRRHLAIWRQLLEPAGTAGNLTTDAHLAALAMEHRATLTTFDGDFHRFTGFDLEYLG